MDVIEVIEVVKTKVRVDKLPEDRLLELMVAEVGQSILTYCNLSVVPPELKFTYANMVIDLINGEKKKAEPDSGRVVTSIKEGDTTVSYGSVRADSSEVAMQSLIFDYKGQLNRFRKMRW